MLMGMRTDIYQGPSNYRGGFKAWVEGDRVILVITGRDHEYRHMDFTAGLSFTEFDAFVARMRAQREADATARVMDDEGPL